MTDISSFPAEAVSGIDESYGAEQDDHEGRGAIVWPLVSVVAVICAALVAHLLAGIQA